MKIALITTTIHIPAVLRLYENRYENFRINGEDISMIVAGDLKSPHDAIRSIDGVTYLHPDDQKHWECSGLIGWNCIQRRNIAVLEAIKSGADIIITIDDDNIPTETTYFSDFVSILTESFSGLMAHGEFYWFNIGGLFNPPLCHRGFPHDYFPNRYAMEPVTDKKIGIAAGLWVGHPDIDAWARIATKNIEYTDIPLAVRNGIIVKQHNFSPFNSQNTGFVRETAPLMAVAPGVGRYDDIWGAYIAERALMLTEYYVHFGRPFTWQQRNVQDVNSNLEDETYGMGHTLQFCDDLIRMTVQDGDILFRLAQIYEKIGKLDYVPPIVSKFGGAWVKDVEVALCN